MSQFSPRRALTAAGLALGTAALGVALAPAALAAPTAAFTASTVAPGAAYTISGTDCISQDPNNDAKGVFSPAAEEAGWGNAVDAGVDGSWSMTMTAPAEVGNYQYKVLCDWYTGGFAYTDVTLTVTPDGKPVPVLGTPRGAAANTAGVASPDTGGATGDKAAPGAKVVKVLTGFKPFEIVTITLNSTPTKVGTFTADAAGTVRAEFVIPAGSQAGDHTLVYEGNLGTYFQETFTVAPVAPAALALASTGASVAVPLSLGLGALAAGGGLVFAARRRTAGAMQA